MLASCLFFRFLYSCWGCSSCFFFFLYSYWGCYTSRPPLHAPHVFFFFFVFLLGMLYCSATIALVGCASVLASCFFFFCTLIGDAVALGRCCISGMQPPNNITIMVHPCASFMFFFSFRHPLYAGEWHRMEKCNDSLLLCCNAASFFWSGILTIQKGWKEQQMQRGLFFLEG